MHIGRDAACGFCFDVFLYVLLARVVTGWMLCAFVGLACFFVYCSGCLAFTLAPCCFLVLINVQYCIRSSYPSTTICYCSAKCDHVCVRGLPVAGSKIPCEKRGTVCSIEI